MIALVVLSALAFSFALKLPLSRHQEVLSKEPYGIVQGARVARTLMKRESIAHINTIANYCGNVVPISSMEYYADCDNDGDPYWLALSIGAPSRNIRAGSPFSWSIRMGDHAPLDHENSSYPGVVPDSPAGSPRAIYTGRLNDVIFESREDEERVTNCFLKRHPDAAWWLPNAKHSPHKSYWSKLTVGTVHLIGGFGDRAYIGEIGADLYHTVLSDD